MRPTRQAYVSPTRQACNGPSRPVSSSPFTTPYLHPPKHAQRTKRGSAPARTYVGVLSPGPGVGVCFVCQSESRVGHLRSGTSVRSALTGVACVWARLPRVALFIKSRRHPSIKCQPERPSGKVERGRAVQPLWVAPFLHICFSCFCSCGVLGSAGRDGGAILHRHGAFRQAGNGGDA